MSYKFEITRPGMRRSCADAAGGGGAVNQCKGFNSQEHTHLQKITTHPLVVNYWAQLRNTPRYEYETMVCEGWPGMEAVT